MNLLFVLDEHNYTDKMPVIERYAVRGLICRNGLWAMQKSAGGDYKIPGGGIESGETIEQALAREVCEETGLVILPESIREIGEVIELREDIYEKGKKYVAHSYHYFCEAKEELVETSMTKSEIAKGYHLAWASIEDIIESNQKNRKDRWIDRDIEFLKWLAEHPECYSGSGSHI